jgi:O-Antigen ligase
MRERTLSDHTDRKLFIGLAIIPVVDCICNQLNNALKLAVGPLSLLQLMRGTLVIVFAVLIVRALLRDWSNVTRIPMPAIGSIAILGMAASKELIVTGGLSMNSLSAYGQMLYWVLLWTTVSVLCRRPDQRDIILRGLVWGACLTAISVVLGLFFGAINYYKGDSVISSAGWFDTAKMITGPLVVGGILILYLTRDRRSWLACCGAGFCFVACVLTYARAGSVALVSVLLWFVVWRALVARDKAGRWLNRFLIGLAGACLLVPATVDMSKLLARWSDKGGSGRSTFWTVAVDAYVTETTPAQALGIGYNSMSEMLLRNYGDDIKHTHNDMLDALLVGGFVGVLWLIGLIASFARRVLLSHLSSIEGAAGVAIVLTYICHGLLTGQIWGTDAMTYYTLSLTCLIRNTDDPNANEQTKVYSLGRRELLA